MKTAVIGEDAEGLVIYNRALVESPASRTLAGARSERRRGRTSLSLYRARSGGVLASCRSGVSKPSVNRA
jgi:hypothetical protein